jgi:hypothetical protein
MTKRQVCFLVFGIALGVLAEKLFWAGCVSKAAEAPTAIGTYQTYEPYRSYVSVYMEKRGVLFKDEKVGLGLAMVADAIHDAAKLLRDAERK